MYKAVMDIKEEGREEGQLLMLANLAEKKIITIEQAAKEAGMSVNEFLEKMTISRGEDQPA